MSSSRRVNSRLVILDSSSESEPDSSFDLNESTSSSSSSNGDDHLQDDNPRNQIKGRQPIVIDGSNDAEDDCNVNIENCMKALQLGDDDEVKKDKNRKKPFKSQLASLNFDSSSSESDDSKQIGGKRQGFQKRSKRGKDDDVIELLDTDSEQEESSSTSVGDSESGFSNINYEKRSTQSLQSPEPLSRASKIRTPLPCESPLDIGLEECSIDSNSKSSSPDDDNGTAWKINKHGNYILQGKCMISGSSKWPKLNVPKKLFDKLYDHQKVGVQFLAGLHAKHGGILGDDMGLGKTFQTCTILGALMRSRTIKNALIVCPVAVMATWEREGRMILDKCCGLKVTIRIIDSSIRRERRAILLEEALSCSPSHPSVTITSYGLVKSSRLDFLGGRKDDSLFWDYIVADEGHQIKNPNTDQHKAIARIARSPETHRLLLTGTPIQNNMKELWALFDWATRGAIFGTLKTFLQKYAVAIENGRNKDASKYTLQQAEKANKDLQAKLRPHFLQRMKNAEFKDVLPVKKELVVWTHLSDLQRKLYDEYVVDGGKVAAILSGEMSSPLEAITWLKKLCDHPSLVGSSRPEELRSESAKLNILVYLVLRLKKSNHRCLIFSPSTKILDIIEKVLPLKLGRIDGSTKGKDRQRIVDIFNENADSFDALLLSTKAAGVGLTLTGADRAIIFSPSWNPADDSQAVDRIGQRNNVTVYRFITAGTVEEHMYARQVEKDGIRRTLMTTAGCATERHFSVNDLKKLFHLGPKGECQMLDKIKRGIQNGARGSSGLRSILEKHEGVIGVSSHDQVYSNSIIDLSEQAPFAGTPMKSNSERGFLAPYESGTHLTFAELANEAVPVRSSAAHNLNRSKKRVLISTLREDRKQTFDSSRFDEELKKVEELTVSGDVESSLITLFQLVESSSAMNLEGANKLQVHKKIASRLLILGLG